MIMKKGKNFFCNYILLEYYSSPFFSLRPSFFFSLTPFGWDVDLLIQCLIQLRINGMLKIQ